MLSKLISLVELFQLSFSSCLAINYYQKVFKNVMYDNIFDIYQVKAAYLKYYKFINRVKS